MPKPRSHFGRLEVVARLPPDERGRVYYDCRCECGNPRRVLRQSLYNGVSACEVCVAAGVAIPTTLRPHKKRVSVSVDPEVAERFDLDPDRVTGEQIRLLLRELAKLWRGPAPRLPRE